MCTSVLVRVVEPVLACIALDHEALWIVWLATQTVYFLIHLGCGCAEVGHELHPGRPRKEGRTRHCALASLARHLTSTNQNGAHVAPHKTQQRVAACSRALPQNHTRSQILVLGSIIIPSLPAALAGALAILAALLRLGG